ITPEGGRGDVARERLTTDRRALEIDVDLEAGTVIGPELSPGRAIVDAHRLDHANVAPLHRLRLDAGLFDCVGELLGAAVQDGYLATVDLDVDIVHAEPQQRGHQVLDCGNMSSGEITQQGRQIRRTDRADLRSYLGAVELATQPMKNDPCIGVCRVDVNGDGLTAMNADA